MTAAAAHSTPPRTGNEDATGLRVVEFDFEKKHLEAIDITAVRSAISAGKFVWLDIDTSDHERVRTAAPHIDGLTQDILDEVFTHEPVTQCSKYEDSLHVVVTGVRILKEDFEFERVDMVLLEHAMVTLHKGEVPFLREVERHYRADFYRFAKSPSFLLYELWDHLIQSYLKVQKRFAERVATLQRELMREVDESVFARVSEIGADLLQFRKVLLPAREVLTELSTRKSLFISEATQPYLANMVGVIERILQDLLSDRDILSDSLNLHMSMISHRTNRVMNKLTVVSVIFLPLTFLCGVYGMNFEILPETKWRFGYGFFWFSAAVISLGLVWFMKKNKLL